MKESKLNRRSFLRMSATSALGMAALAACSPAAPTQEPAQQATDLPASTATPAPAEVVKITHWDLSRTESEIENLDKAYLGFNSVQSVYQVEPVHGKDEDAVLPAVAAGNPPDCFWRWSYASYGSWINKKIIMDLTPYVQASSLDWNRFVPASLTSVQWKGKYYGMPLTSAGIGLYYWNKEMAQKAGLDPEKVPQSLDELIVMSDQLVKRDSDGNISELGFHWNIGPIEWSLLFDANFWDENANKLTPTDPGIVSAFQWVADYYQHNGIEAIDRFVAGLPTDGYFGSGHPVCKDMVAEYGGYEWDMLFMTTVAGCESSKFGIAKMPSVPGHPDYPTCTQGTIALVVPTGASNPDGAWQFMEYLQGVEPTGIICSGLINCAQIVDAVEYPAYRDNPVLKFASELAVNSKAFPGYIPVAAEYFAELEKAYDLVIHGKASAEEALQGVYDQVQPQLDAVL